MIQFYALSVFLNVLAGYALVSAEASAGGTRLDALRELLEDPTLRLVVGVLTATTGVFKLLSVLPGDIPVVGDLVPCFAGLAAGFTLLLEFYKRNSNVSSPVIERLEALFLGRRKLVGKAAIFAGSMHFLFAKVLFL